MPVLNRNSLKCPYRLREFNSLLGIFERSLRTSDFGHRLLFATQPEDNREIDIFNPLYGRLIAKSPEIQKISPQGVDKWDKICFKMGICGKKWWIVVDHTEGRGFKCFSGSMNTS